MRLRLSWVGIFQVLLPMFMYSGAILTMTEKLTQNKDTSKPHPPRRVHPLKNKKRRRDGPYGGGVGS